jgi:NADH:ubiquinone oxidoreductase subunit 6 (subunit J)
MDTSILTRIIFFGTVFLLPGFAVGLLALHTSVHAGHWVRLGSVIYFGTAFCLSLILGVLTWTNRPKIQQKEQPSVDTAHNRGQADA